MLARIALGRGACQNVWTISDVPSSEWLHLQGCFTWKILEYMNQPSQMLSKRMMGNQVNRSTSLDCACMSLDCTHGGPLKTMGIYWSKEHLRFTCSLSLFVVDHDDLWTSRNFRSQTFAVSSKRYHRSQDLSSSAWQVSRFKLRQHLTEHSVIIRHTRSISFWHQDYLCIQWRRSTPRTLQCTTSFQFLHKNSRQSFNTVKNNFWNFIVNFFFVFKVHLANDHFLKILN